MSQRSLIRNDQEFQRQIRQQQMTDWAKIGLLVGLNVQQFQTNQLLSQNLEAACHTNEALRHIAGTIEQIASLQQTHFDQVQRERSLKEVAFQFEKFMDETERVSDPVSAAYGTKRLFDIVDHPVNGFTTADLSDLDDKRHFDALIARAKKALTSLSNNDFERLDHFEKLYGIYLQRKSDGYDADQVFPFRKHESLAEKFRSRPNIDNDAKAGPGPMYTEAELSKQKVISGLQIGCGGLMLLWGVLMFIIAINMAIVDRDPGRLGGLVCFLPFTATGGVMVALFFKKRKEQTQLNERNQEELSKRIKQWEIDKRKEEIRVSAVNTNIDEENAKIEERRRKGRKIYEATMNEMRNLINGFLDDHPPILQFVAKV